MFLLFCLTFSSLFLGFILFVLTWPFFHAILFCNIITLTVLICLTLYLSLIYSRVSSLLR